MFGKKEILTAVGTVGCAIGIGLVMQSSDTADKRYGKIETSEVAVEPIEGATRDNGLLDVQQITLTSAEFDTGIDLPETDAEVVTAAAPQSVLTPPDVPASPDATVNPACEIIANARPVAAAMVDLSMEASCLPNERVTIHHNGMIFTETTTAQGSLSLRVPALTQDAVFVIAFTNGDGAVAQTIVEEIDNFDRAVLQWKGNTGFQIHAREFGADYGDVGHLWEGAPGEVLDAVTGIGGVLTRHGDKEAADPLLAEVYSFPKTGAERQGIINLSVETEVTASNCGIEVEAQSLEIQADGKIKTQDLTLPVPDCDAVGSFLVLNNLLQDLKVAAK